MKQKEIIYYKDELNEEFSTAKIVPRKIDENYKYIHKSVIWNAIAFLLQNVLSVPIKFLYAKIKFKIKYVGKEKLKTYKKQGYFIYGNHTQIFADTFITSNTNYPKKNFFIVNPENVSMKFLGNIVEMLGAIPIPSNKEAMKNFLEVIEKRIKDGNSVTIFPEAHIWPYYTKIRPFKTVSFKYPVQLNVPTFSVTNTYQSYGKNNDKVRIVTYVDGPFFPDDECKTMKEKQQNLRDKVYKKMVERSQNSNIEVIKYVKKEE
ncbi:phospholipid/glycerol acyltransferase [Clostridium sp. CAG:575]|nr:phospholipid/glycerol acyltransferase [Clostridium sp. CAG:575]